MLYLNDIKFESQGFKGEHLGISPNNDKSVLFFESIAEVKDVKCPECVSWV